MQTMCPQLSPMFRAKQGLAASISAAHDSSSFYISQIPHRGQKMSGIEVAGLILGAVPLIIAALEQYKKTRETLNRFRRKALYIDRLIDALEEQRVLIESDLNQLLRAAGVESDEIAAAGAASCHDLLQSPEIARDIAQYLGQTFQPYQKALKRCECALQDIARNIGGLTPGFQVCINVLWWQLLRA